MGLGRLAALRMRILTAKKTMNGQACYRMYDNPNPSSLDWHPSIMEATGAGLDKCKPSLWLMDCGQVLSGISLVS